MHNNRFKWLQLATSIAVAGAVSWFVLGDDGSSAQQSNFVGGEPQREEVDDARIVRLRFAAGS
ncbi:MAG: hypothetical protein RL120_06940, partial [Gammaproteobacteria bacterium]